MKKFALALLTTTAAFTGSAFAADLPMKAPAPVAAPAPAFSWTGCYIGAGFGYGMWNQETAGFFEGAPSSFNETGGGRGWFGTVGGGCDYQFNLGIGIPGINTMVIGALADGDWGSIKGTTHISDGIGQFGAEKLTSQWDVGGRIGWLVTPQVLTYFSGGYTQARFNQVTLLPEFGLQGQPVTGLALPAHTYHGWFLGSGLEYTTNWLPGLFWKTEYRFSEFNRDQLGEVCIVSTCGIGPTPFTVDSQKWVQTIRTELVYRFNWGGPVVGRY